MSSSFRLLTPTQLNAHLGRTPSLCSAHLGWPWMRIESWRNPTGHGELNCPAGTHHELILPLAGSSTTLRRFGNTHCESTDGILLNQFDLIPRGHENYWLWKGSGCEYASFDITPEFLRRVAEENEEFRTPNFELMPIAGGTDSRLRSIAVSLVLEMEDRGSSGSLFADTLMTALAARLLRCCTVQPPPTAVAARGFSGKVLAQITEFIDANISRTCGLRELSAIADCSPWAFCRRFKLTTGVPPHQFVMAKRIAQSKSLLNSTDQSLSQIALACGFSSHSHFSTAFLKNTGITPATYRNAKVSQAYTDDRLSDCTARFSRHP